MVALLDATKKARELFVEDVFPEGFEWVGWLTPRHLMLFGIELNAALANPDAERIQAMLDAWEATAELDQSPDLRSQIAANRAGRFVGADEWLKRRQSRIG